MQRHDPWAILSPAIALDYSPGFSPAVGPMLLHCPQLINMQVGSNAADKFPPRDSVQCENGAMRQTEPQRTRYRVTKIEISVGHLPKKKNTVLYV